MSICSDRLRSYGSCSIDKNGELFMEITKEQFMSTVEYHKRIIKRIGIITKIMIVFSVLCVLTCAVTAAAFIASRNKDILDIAMTAIAASVLILLIFSLYGNTVSKKYDHCPASKNISGLMKKLRNEYFTNDYMSWASGLLRTENDVLCRGFIRRSLISANLFRGEFDIAFRANIPDNELFRKDRFYELCYLSNVMNYQFAAGGDREAAENAYRRFNELFYSGLIDTSIFSTMILAVDSEITYSMEHGNWERAIYYIDMFSLVYESELHKGLYGAAVEYAAHMMNKAEALYHLGYAEEARALIGAWIEYLRPFPYRYNKAQQLLSAASQGGLSQ